MASDLIRESAVGFFINKFSKGKILPYTEEKPDFVVPQRYLEDPPLLSRQRSLASSIHSNHQTHQYTTEVESPESKPESFKGFDSDGTRVESLYHEKSDQSDDEENGLCEKPVAYTTENCENIVELKPYKSQDPLASPDDSRSTDHGQYIVVDWYGPDDKDNPKNWPAWKKLWTVFAIAFLTVSIYMGSSIYTPGAAQIMSDLNTTRTKAVLPLTMFVIGYGVGPMVLSPLSEHPPLGRTFLYIINLALFCILQVPIALAKNVETIIGLRFLAGVFASPALSTGGATVGDVLSEHMFVGLLAWSIGAFCGPTFGPLIGGVFSQLVSWRWTFWFLCCISGFALAILSVFLPETNHATILHRRAARLRKLTGNMAIRSSFEVQEKQTTTELIKDTLWRPIVIIFEPIVTCLNIYSAFIYIVINSWFESLPIVFNEFYKFNLIEGGLVYLAAIVGGLIGGCFYYYTYNRINKSNNPNIEKYLIPAKIGAFFLPVALFIFSWGTSTETHWMAPVSSLTIFSIGGIFIFQSIFAYLGKGFPRFLASVYAGNCLVRSVSASVFPLFTHSMYARLAREKFPVALAGTIWACISVLMIAIPFLISHYGVRLRGRSKYAN